MITTLDIEGFRGFRKFQLSGLGRVNLLVGTNNCGKTSVLEAIHLLRSGEDEWALRSILSRRNEYAVGTRERLDLSNLFHNRASRRGLIRITGGGTEREFKGGDTSVLISPGLPAPFEIPASVREPLPRLDSGSLFLGIESLSLDDLAGRWNAIALTPAEDLVVEALRFLDPLTERVAAITPGAGFIVRRKGSDRPIPIGSMGGGMTRMLALAVALVQCRGGGTLLVDEIDTGLHYTVMSRMWQLVYREAVKLDVQVFATTHSYDCIHSLAQLGFRDPENKITVQRIEPEKGRAVPYDEDELAAAASLEIEVR